MRTAEKKKRSAKLNSASRKTTTKKKPLKVSATGGHDDLRFQLGIWFAGLKSFLNLCSNEAIKANFLTHDWSKEIRLSRSTLQLCSKLTIDFLHQLEFKKASSNKEKKSDILDDEGLELGYEILSEKETLQLSVALKELVLFSETLLRSNPLSFQDWVVWSKSLIDKLNGISSVQKLIRFAEYEGGKFLPEAVEVLLEKNNIEPRLLSNLKIILPQLARILKLLSVVGKMLEKDKPLKPSLLLFARVKELVSEMVDYINSCLIRYPNKKDAFFSSMQSLEYVASIELRKVYDWELKELIRVRSVPVVFAKIERSFALLNDSMQFALLNFAQLTKPNLKFSDVFPSLKTKEEQSIILREEIWSILCTVKEAEKDPENYPIDALSEKLGKFNEMITGALFYRDVKTVQGFIEGILKAREREELMTILHRFHVYLETLLGQINMRTVLSDHPFEPFGQDTPEIFA